MLEEENAQLRDLVGGLEATNAALRSQLDTERTRRGARERELLQRLAAAEDALSELESVHDATLAKLESICAARDAAVAEGERLRGELARRGDAGAARLREYEETVAALEEELRAVCDAVNANCVPGRPHSALSDEPSPSPRSPSSATPLDAHLSALTEDATEEHRPLCSVSRGRSAAAAAARAFSPQRAVRMVCPRCAWSHGAPPALPASVTGWASRASPPRTCDTPTPTPSPPPAAPMPPTAPASRAASAELPAVAKGAAVRGTDAAEERPLGDARVIEGLPTVRAPQLVVQQGASCAFASLSGVATRVSPSRLSRGSTEGGGPAAHRERLRRPITDADVQLIRRQKVEEAERAVEAARSYRRLLEQRVGSAKLLAS